MTAAAKASSSNQEKRKNKNKTLASTQTTRPPAALYEASLHLRSRQANFFWDLRLPSMWSRLEPQGSSDENAVYSFLKVPPSARGPRSTGKWGRRRAHTDRHARGVGGQEPKDALKHNTARACIGSDKFPIARALSKKNSSVVYAGFLPSANIWDKVRKPGLGGWR